MFFQHIEQLLQTQSEAIELSISFMTHQTEFVKIHWIPLLRPLLDTPLRAHHREVRIFSGFHFLIQKDYTFPVQFNLIFHGSDSIIWYIFFFHLWNWGVFVYWRDSSNFLNGFPFSNVPLPLSLKMTGKSNISVMDPEMNILCVSQKRLQRITTNLKWAFSILWQLPHIYWVSSLHPGQIFLAIMFSFPKISTFSTSQTSPPLFASK